MGDMTLLLDEEQEIEEIGSYNHSTVQANLAFLFKRLGKYSVAVELSLDSSPLVSTLARIKDELIPDVCIYPKRDLSTPFDILKMEEMPLLVVEVLSPRQFSSSLLEKFQAYFVLGVKSCWLVDTITHTVHVYSSMTQWRSFAMDEKVMDQLLDIQMSVAEIFE